MLNKSKSLQMYILASLVVQILNQQFAILFVYYSITYFIPHASPVPSSTQCNCLISYIDGSETLYEATYML
jgi:hypothetical protein